MSRIEAAAKELRDAFTVEENIGEYDASAVWGTPESVAESALAAADAHDQANGIHRVKLDDATVERAARALFVIENPEADWEALPLNQWVTDIYRKRTRAVLAAALEGSGE